MEQIGSQLQDLPPDLTPQSLTTSLPIEQSISSIIDEDGILRYLERPRCRGDTMDGSRGRGGLGWLFDGEDACPEGRWW
jgi:hypothetical protein